MQGSAAVGIVCSVGVHIVQSVATLCAVYCEGAVATVHCEFGYCALLPQCIVGVIIVQCTVLCGIVRVDIVHCEGCHSAL